MSTFKPVPSPSSSASSSSSSSSSSSAPPVDDPSGAVDGGAEAILETDVETDSEAESEGPSDDGRAPLALETLLAALATLEAVSDDPTHLVAFDQETRIRLQRACGAIARPDLKAKKKLHKAVLREEHRQKRAHDEAVRDATGIRQLRQAPVFPTPALRAHPRPPKELAEALFQGASAAAIDPAAPPMLSPPSPTSPTSSPSAPSSPCSTPGTALEAGPALQNPRACYVCRQPFTVLHHFYDQLCQSCGDFNEAKRAPRADLRGRQAIVTGARVKIGYQAAMLLLRNGADVVVTTRFPRDAAARYAREVDVDDWRGRLQIWGLDLRHTPSVDAIARHFNEHLPRLDFIIHNACQTVRRPPDFYGHLMAHENRALEELSPLERQFVAAYEAYRADVDVEPSAGRDGEVGLLRAANLSQVQTDADDVGMAPLALASGGASTGMSLFPAGALDADLQQIDLRTHNSWRATLGEVPVVELLEVLLVNAAAPFVLTSKLLPLMKRDNDGGDRHIVNVSAMEGQFYRYKKTEKHPHTNMAKAALNMLTRTSAMELEPEGIWMNAVDTGWVTDEDPAHIAIRKAADHRFSPPLDIVDGAARIVDPIFVGVGEGKHASGVFFKDYKPTPW